MNISVRIRYLILYIFMYLEHIVTVSNYIEAHTFMKFIYIIYNLFQRG